VCFLCVVCTTVTKLNQVCQSINPTIITICLLLPYCSFNDTTFKLGDFYVSPLVFRNIIFEYSPIMPVAFLIHGRKKEKVHARFFDFVSSVFPKLNRKCVPFVTDRGTALVNAIGKNFPNCDVIMCWNHLINDFKFSLQKMGMASYQYSKICHDYYTYNTRWIFTNIQ
jgi:hypothetical protein